MHNNIVKRELHNIKMLITLKTLIIIFSILENIIINIYYIILL